MTPDLLLSGMEGQENIVNKELNVWLRSDCKGIVQTGRIVRDPIVETLCFYKLRNREPSEQM